jgi:hypothetical protein
VVLVNRDAQQVPPAAGHRHAVDELTVTCQGPAGAGGTGDHAAIVDDCAADASTDRDSDRLAGTGCGTMAGHAERPRLSVIKHRDRHVQCVAELLDEIGRPSPE